MCSFIRPFTSTFKFCVKVIFLLFDFIRRRPVVYICDKKLYEGHHDLVDPSDVAVFKLISDLMSSVKA